MKTLTLMFVLFIPILVAAEVGIHFNKDGNFIPPDTYLQNVGLKQYQNGSINTAIHTLKKSAEFGNEMSKYLVSILYFEKKQWVTGYAWLMLVEKPIEKRDDLLKKLNAQLTDKEKASAEKKLKKLKKKYNDIQSLRRRHKWDKSIAVVGTHIRGVDGFGRKNISFGGRGLPFMVSKKVKEYVNDVDIQGIVIMGEIKEKHEEQDDQETQVEQENQ